MSRIENPVQAMTEFASQLTTSDENVHFMSVMHDLLTVIQCLIKGTASLHPLPVPSKNIASVWRIDGLHVTLTLAYDSDILSQEVEDGVGSETHPEQQNQENNDDNSAYCQNSSETQSIGNTLPQLEGSTEIANQNFDSSHIKSEEEQEEAELKEPSEQFEQPSEHGELSESCHSELQQQQHASQESTNWVETQNPIKIEPDYFETDNSKELVEGANACFAECIYENPSSELESNSSRPLEIPEHNNQSQQPGSKTSTNASSLSRITANKKQLQRCTTSIRKRALGQQQQSHKIVDLQKKMKQALTRSVFQTNEHQYLSLVQDDLTDDGPSSLTRSEQDSSSSSTTCSFCQKQFAYVSQRLYHESCHTGLRPFKCEYCPRRFSRLFNLKQHERIHTGERPFKCSICLKAFGRSYQLKSHQLAVHMGVKFQCTLCMKLFAYKSDLRRHERIHKLST